MFRQGDEGCVSASGQGVWQEGSGTMIMAVSLGGWGWAPQCRLEAEAGRAGWYGSPGHGHGRKIRQGVPSGDNDLGPGQRRTCGTVAAERD